MPRPSARAAAAPASPIRKLAPFAEAARARGVEVLPLNIGQPDLETPAIMRRGLGEHREEVIAYSPSQGAPGCRAFLLDYYRALGVSLEPEDLLVTTGGSEAISFALAACTDPGDAVLVPDPMYANYLGFSAMLGVDIRPLPTSIADGYHLPTDLDAAWDPRLRAVLLCNPCNPTGTVYTPAEIERVIDLCRRRDLFLVVDEVYREFVYDGPIPESLLRWEGVEDRVVVVDSLSKRFSMCGARVGCLVSRNRQVTAAALRFAQARLSPPALGQLVGARAALLDPGYFDAVRELYRGRRDRVWSALAAIPGVEVHRPEGAFYLMARLPVGDAEAFARFLLRDFHHEGVTAMVAPGAGFYAEPGRGAEEVRIAYVLEEERLTRAMEALTVGIGAWAQTRRAAG